MSYAQRRMSTDADLRSSGASLCMREITLRRIPAESASLKTRPPVACDLASVPMTHSTMSWHGQAEQPMMPRGRSVCAVVPDTQGPSPWTRLAGRVWFAAVWPQSMYSGTSPRLCGKPVWWAPRHGGVAGSGQVRVCELGKGALASELASLKRLQRRRGGALAPLRTSPKRRQNPIVSRAKVGFIFRHTKPTVPVRGQAQLYVINL